MRASKWIVRISSIHKTSNLGGKISARCALSGDHNKIKDWRLSQSEAITRDRRPDLWQKYKKN